MLSLPGDPERPVSLEVTLYTPSGPGPFPLAVMNHGADSASGINRGERYRFTIAAYYFLSRGYAVALPMMRGFAGSGGNLVHAGCDLDAVGVSNARDIRAVIEALSARPDIDRTRVVVAGQSFGAWNTLALGTLDRVPARGLISFNAAFRASDCAAQDSSMVAAAARFGARTSLPSLWFYGDNDHVMPKATWQAMYGRYQQAGGHGELVAFGSYGADSHQLLSFSDTLPLWTPRVDAFLARIGLPATVVNPDYLPMPFPPATHWAALDDVGSVPFMNDQGRALYRKFLAASFPRVFVVAPNGAGFISGGYDPLRLALRSCAEKAGGACRPYAVNDAVVWTGPKQENPGQPIIRAYSRTVPAETTTVLGVFYAVNPDCSPRGLPTVRISEPPSHGTAAAGPREANPAFPPASPFAVCNASRVPAVGVTYAPVKGFTGADSIAIEEVTRDGRHQLIRLTLSVQ